MDPRSAAEATHFHLPASGVIRPGHEGRGSPNAAFLSAQSMRLSARPIGSGLVFRLALPVIVALLVAFIMFSIVIQRKISNSQINDLKSDATNAVFAFSVWARLLFLQQEKFFSQNPDFQNESEWLNANYWLVANGYVREDEWIEATGFELNEYVPIRIIKRAAEKTILNPIAQWINSPNTPTGIVAIHILNSDGTYLASAISNTFRQDVAVLRSIPPPPESYTAEGVKISVEYIDSLDTGPVVRAMARIMSPLEPARILGSAVIIARTGHHAFDQRSFILYASGLMLLLTAFMTAVCWYVARRVTKPMRRLAADMQAMAEGDYSRRSAVTESNELGLLIQAFNSLAERLRVARVNEKENSRLESDLATAKSIQNNLLPLQTPRIRGLDIHTAYRPAREIGGDYFDFLPVDNQHMGIVVADASGKSIPAALVMSTTRAILRFVAPGNQSAAETLTQVNAILSVDIPKGMFVTAYYIIFDPLGSTMLCSSAGHTPLLIARGDGTVELLNPGGIALGFDNGPIFQRAIREQQVKLQTGDRVLVYTDGVVECVNPANEEYSDRRLREFLRRNRQMSSHDFVGALLTDLDRHRGTAEMRDDTTIMTFKVL